MQFHYNSVVRKQNQDTINTGENTYHIPHGQIIPHFTSHHQARKQTRKKEEMLYWVISRNKGWNQHLSELSSETRHNGDTLSGKKNRKKRRKDVEKSYMDRQLS